jgi:DNA-directed RNA polymerase subunit RPC12/RpoP
MRQPNQITVIFACSNCGAAYKATQEAVHDIGSFDCWECKSEIFSWSGAYKYCNWSEIAKAPAVE